MASADENCITSKLNPSFLKDVILNGELNRPVVIRRKTDRWPCRNWTLDDWGAKFGQMKLRFRIGATDRSDPGPLWESKCDFIEATVSEFVQWQTTEDGHREDAKVDTLFSTDRSKHWAYADYKHMLQLFDTNNDENEDMFRCVDWSGFGFDGRNGKESTIWIGSENSETPCHYDTYGCNLVAQLIGRKRWILFPPNDAKNLYPTRIPYEESSVFSQVNIQNPNVTKHDKFKFVTPYIVTLEPGEVLFVPHKWWHYVSSLTTTVSMNTWIELESDNERRLEEAVTRTLMSAFAETYPFPNADWLNPTEEEIFPEENLSYVKESIERCIQRNISIEICKREVGIDETMSSDHCSSPKAKKMRTELNLNEYGDEMKPIEPSSYSKLINFVKECTTKEQKNEEELFQTLLINSIVDSEVISLICENLRSKVIVKSPKCE